MKSMLVHKRMHEGCITNLSAIIEHQKLSQWVVNRELVPKWRMVDDLTWADHLLSYLILHGDTAVKHLLIRTTLYLLLSSFVIKNQHQQTVKEFGLSRMPVYYFHVFTEYIKRVVNSFRSPPYWYNDHTLHS